MHILHEIFTEGYEEENAQDSAQQRTEEYLIEFHHDVGIGSLKDKQSRKSEYGACHYHSRTRAYRLDDHILPEGIFLLQSVAETHRDNGDRNGGLKHLPYFQSEISCRRTEHNSHQQTHTHGIGSHLLLVVSWFHHRNVLFVFRKLAEGVFRQSGVGGVDFFVFFHKISVRLNK
ncbi:hypothetical protein IMSAG025_02409 [Muribaculaceae bacterium]|nr:hypothetical protein IMSAG025_02409 [Muribaculaceae bacterium]